MARTPFTLAASVTAAVPGARIVAAGALTDGAAGRFDSAVVVLDDGRRLAVRVAATVDAAEQLRAEARALAALTDGVRAVLPFAAPVALGQTVVDGSPALVTDLIDGWHVDAAQIPDGRGVATALGAALAAVHALPVAVVRSEGLPVRTSDQVRDETRRLIDRAAASGHLPRTLRARWMTAIDADSLWEFETVVVLGGVDAGAFVFTGDDDLRVSGLIDWHGLSVGDAAADLHWLAAARVAAATVREAYAAASVRAGDAHLTERSRLYAELEFAKWLVHGLESDDHDVVADAASLLASLDESTRGEDLTPVRHSDVQAAMDVLDRVPAAATPRGDTSLQTDAFDRADLSAFGDIETGETRDDLAVVDGDADPAGDVDDDPQATQPIEAASWGAGSRTIPHDPAPPTLDLDLDPVADADEAERASRAALRRWAVGGD
jgi:macrolide phosphotransferase